MLEQPRVQFQNTMEEIHFSEYFQVILRRRWVIITFFTVLFTTVLIGTLKQTPIYEATTTLLIEHKSPKVISVQEVTSMGAGDYASYREYYETQYKLIKSPTLLKKVADTLGLKADDTRKGNASVKKLLKAVKVAPVRNSQLVEISAEDPDPELAAKIANTVADEYIKQNLGRNINTANEAAVWLSKQIAEQKDKVMKSEIALQEYRLKNNINVLPDMTGEAAIEDVKAEYAKLQAQLANYSQRYTDEHPKIIELKAQINSLKNKVQGLEDVDVGAQSMEYRVLEREFQTNKQMYEVLLTRLKEISVSSTLNVNNLSVIDRAQVPMRPTKPKVKQNIILAIILGLFGGIGLAFVIDYLDNTIKSVEDVRNILEVHVLGSIPDIEGKDESKKDKIALYEPHSPVSEAYKTVRTEVCRLMEQSEGLKKVILITSAEPQAGKTTTVSNLGISLAQKGGKIVLVDADLRKPQLHKIFNLEKHSGLSEYLTDGINMTFIIKDTEIENLKVITSGKIPRNPAEIIGCARMKEFIGDLKERFDLVIFDSPPVISVTDSIILGDMVDCLIQVIRSGKAFVPVVLRARERLENIKARNLGVILNDLNIYHGDYYYYRYYRYYYGEDANRRTQRDSPKELAGKFRWITKALNKTSELVKLNSRK
jgi:capsular exopolysaccharide synthesis family protein